MLVLPFLHTALGRCELESRLGEVNRLPRLGEFSIMALASTRYLEIFRDGVRRSSAY